MENHGTDFKRRWKVLRERVQAMKEIWTKEAAEYHGEFVNFDPIWSYPKPVQKGGPPVLLGSEAKKGPERAVAYCDGWMPINRKPEQLVEGLKSLREAADRAGRKFESLTLGLFAAPGKEDAARRVMDMGFSHLIFPLPPAKADAVMPLLDHYGTLADKLRH
jgi:alkanesulfonate monooxygenase SsuD/methylene tetrahydromethanopterin reductase-like flavin-dependent oxidoreductase (luciferase family)